MRSSPVKRALTCRLEISGYDINCAESFYSDGLKDVDVGSLKNVEGLK